MAIANWSSRYETGIELIDAQHKSLFTALNVLADSFRTGRSKALMDESLEALLAYTAEHFHTEERYMREFSYPGLAAHLAEHAILIVKARELRERFTEGSPVVMDVTIFFVELLKHHIDKVDRAMVEFLKGQQQA